MKSICKPLEDLGIHYFAHVNIDADKRFSALGMEPEFVKMYFDKEYYKYDIHMADMDVPEQYIMWDTIERSKETKTLYDDFTAMNLGHTFTIVQDDNGTRDCYHFSAPLGNDWINQQNLNQLDLLQKFILYFRDKVSDLKELRQAYMHKVAIPEDNAGYHTTQNKAAIQREQFLNQIDFERIHLQNKVHLTPKESECLYWHALGKTAEETAMIMNNRPRTVKAHIKSAKAKLNCETQFQLGVKYSKLKQLKPYT